MPGSLVRGQTAVPGIVDSMDTDGRVYLWATIGDLPSTESVSPGTAGVVEMVNGGPRFRMENAVVATPSGQLPGVAQGHGDKGDLVRVMIFGQASATFRTSLTTTTNKTIRVGAGAVTANANGTDRQTYATVVGSGAASSKTQTIFLAGVWL